VPDKAAPCPLDLVQRQFHARAPNRLWLSDFTYVATWGGFVSVAFVNDAYARRIVGWRASRSAHAGLFSMPWNRRCMSAGPMAINGWSTTPVAAANLYPSSTPGVWPRPVLSLRLEWVDWFNNRRLLEPIRNIPPAEAEQRYYAALERLALVA
jgi:transposase InsO family protein